MTLYHGTRHTGSISKTKSLKEIALPNTLLSYTIDTKTIRTRRMLLKLKANMSPPYVTGWKQLISTG